MKRKNKISLTVLILAVGAWVAPSALSGEEEKECKEIVPVHVVHASSSITVTPPFVVICGGKMLTLDIVPPNRLGVGKVVTAPESSDPNAAWLNNANTPNPNQIAIKVPTVPATTTFKYSVEIEGLGKIDPRVRVKK